MSKQSGYILPANHYRRYDVVTQDDYTITHEVDGVAFIVYKLPENRIFITGEQMFDCLESCGDDLCDEIESDHPVVEMLFNGSYPAEMVAFVNQPKLF